MSLFKHKHKWEMVRTIWPYAEGWGTRCKECRMILDTGLSNEMAKRRLDVREKQEDRG